MRSDARLRSHANADIERRRAKARQIESVVVRAVGPLDRLDVLDIGTGSGYIASYLDKRARSLESVDVVDERVAGDFAYHQIADEALPFEDGRFDVVISNHVIEHVRDGARHLTEVRRVLRSGGIAYLATPNRFALLEPHYRLPMLSWLPAHLRTPYVRATRRGDLYDVQPFTLGRIAALARDCGLVVDDKSLDIAQERIKAICGIDVPISRPLRYAVPSFVLLLRRAPVEGRVGDVGDHAQ